MMPPIHKFINKTIWVSIPSHFEDGKCRAYKLLGVELQGLWLESAELMQRVLPEAMHEKAAGMAVFVPFSQITGVMAPATGTAMALITPAGAAVSSVAAAGSVNTAPSVEAAPSIVATARKAAAKGGHKHKGGESDRAGGGHAK